MWESIAQHDVVFFVILSRSFFLPYLLYLVNMQCLGQSVGGVIKKKKKKSYFVAPSVANIFLSLVVHRQGHEYSQLHLSRWLM